MFFEARFLTGVLGLDTAAEVVRMTVIWCCLALALLVAEIANNYHDIRVTLVARVPQRAVLPIEPGVAVDAPSLQP